jgi:polysaccharide biosynthesis transport protein
MERYTGLLRHTDMNGDHGFGMHAVTYETDHPLKEYMDACRQRLWLIGLMVVCFAAAAATWSLLQTPIYQAKATVGIESPPPGTFDRDRTNYLDNSPEYFQTHFELLKSRLLLRRTAELLKLFQRPEYQPPQNVFDKVFPSWIRAVAPSKDNDGPDAVKEGDEELLKRFSDNVEILPIRGARLAHVTVSSPDPTFAAQAANTLVSVYIERNQELSSSSREQSARWFTTHLNGLREKVQASQQALYLYRAKGGLLTGEERKSLTGHTLAELNSQAVKSEMAKSEALSRLQQIESVGATNDDWSKLDSLTQVLNSHLIQMLLAQEITLSSQVADLSEKYGPLHPDRAQKNAELQNLRQRIKQEVHKIYDSLKHEYNLAVAQERAVKAAISRYGNDKIRVEQNEIEHGMLEREADSNQQMYNLFLKIAKESDLSAGMQTTNIYLADAATPSSVPAIPRTRRNIALALMVGLMSGIGLAIVLEGRNKKLKVPADVERYIPEVSLLGVVPLFPKAARERKALAQSDALTPVAESIRIIRTGVLLSRPDTLPSRVLITSPGDNEGKTTLAINLAMAMAKLEERRVILVDVDFRKAYVHPIYDVGIHSTSLGLAQLLRGEATVEEVVHDSPVRNLSVIPRGDRPGNPTELLHSKSLSQLLDWGLAQGYHLILDCAPALPFADIAVLASKVDGILLVVSAGETTREACRLAVQRMDFAGGKLLGVVMQKANVESSPYNYSAH